MRRRYLVGGIVAAAVVIGGGFGVDAAMSDSGGPAGSAYGAPAGAAGGTSATGLGVAALKPGTALVDGSGRTLYLFEADTRTASQCTGGCAQVWPPLLTSGSAPVISSGSIRPDLVGSIARADGTDQVTYDGHPLYHYVGDKKSGDSAGQGLDQFGAAWYVVAPGGSKIDSD